MTFRIGNGVKFFKQNFLRKIICQFRSNIKKANYCIREIFILMINDIKISGAQAEAAVSYAHDTSIGG